MKFSRCQLAIEELKARRLKLNGQFAELEQAGTPYEEIIVPEEKVALKADVTVNIQQLDTDKKGALVTISQRNQSEEDASSEALRPDWQFEVDPNSTPYRLEQSHIFVSEQTKSLVFTFHSFSTRDFIGSVEVSIDELIRHGLQNGTIWTSHKSQERVPKEMKKATSDGASGPYILDKTITYEAEAVRTSYN